ncbi:IMPACT family protein [Nesterenkonia halotolerans]|uniref:YigZ family protein n=1 Tax=Nesterenkonia halotolerans TaxID=225325 RepID=A0ABR9J3I6_9MICC|nr:YigZ family protein [Nesterenkonia halotolerans]MBE1513553.1 putative YigZ family protein [Nesterenkonia halotolerans]
MPEHAESYTVLRRGAQIHHEIERKRSRFVTVLRRVETPEDAQHVLSELRQANPTARHHCSAWVIGPERSVQRGQDDGEPSGTAGAPMLAALLKSEMPSGAADLSDVLAVVIRWFGGTLLGAGGLVSAYSDSILETLRTSGEQGDMVTRRSMQRFEVAAPIAEVGRWENEFRVLGAHVLGTDYSPDGSAARLLVAVQDSTPQVAELHRHVASLSSGAAVPVAAGQHWTDLGGP